MAPTIHYYCPCQSVESIQTPPPPHMASSSASFHPLHSLFFCEECDAVRCNRCVSVEVSGYYCPNCLFEVPSASVRAEKNRCARNCFSCPICRSTLQVVASDPPDGGDGRPSVSLNGTLPEVGITFEKPTGLAAQLQKFEDSAPESLEFERLKEHFEPFLRTSSLSSLSHIPSTSSHHLPTSSATAAASAALARDVPGVAKYNNLARSRVGRDRTANKDEMSEYKSRMEIGVLGQIGSEGDGSDVEALRRMESVEEIASLEQRWGNSWTTSLRTSDLRPLRIPLHSKVSKRCPTCRHILIKPEQKAQSVRYKIKLVAANYLPAMTVALPHTQVADTTRRPQAKVPSALDDRNTGAMMAGRSYPFHLALTNPLYDPIQVRLSVQRMHVTAVTNSTAPEKARRTPFAVSLPTSSFPVAAFAEAWEYDDDDDMFGLEDDELGLEMGRTRDKDGKGKVKTVGVLEKRANVTVVGGEVVIGKEARGHVKFNMLVSYTYRSDDPLPSEDGAGTPSRTVAKTPEVKTFTFYTVVDLGPILPREEKLDPDI
ncbi:dynactin p62 family-domain-containing protein [Suillus bovinus]|uniref:dynactin p62 family-domain-containing protein n=1 Tax=Suillus bovinus TaxID=48563 RepID=UPI001B86ECFD|nr:dynactin p62 family-domain-containing protein [Suillus bovinus]KAG2155769.1 dynactin p62 family-domain-containing protein [Suillus bovinus]